MLTAQKVCNLIGGGLGAVFLLAFALCCLVGSSSSLAANSKPAKLTPLTIVTQDGTSHQIFVEVANNNASRQKGLMFRKELAANQGMLFDFGKQQDLVMWMKDTPLSLDMFFADVDGLIFYIAENTTPFSTKLIAAPLPGRYVLEAPAGTARRLGLQRGDMLDLPE